MQVKYMGLADVRKLEKGEDFGGRLNKDYALDRDIEWNWENNHVIDTDEVEGVDDEFWTLLLEEPDFKDVTDMKRIPTNEAQRTWRAMGKNEETDAAVGVKESGTAETPSTGPAGGQSEASGGETTATGAGSTPPASTGRRRSAT